MTFPSLSSSSPSWLRRLLPPRTSVNRIEVVRASAGALFGILATGLLSALWLGPTSAALWLMAPMGASAVLLFAVPASPLAQPWSIVGGNVVAALVGVSCFKLIGTPIPAAAAAIFVAIAAMLALRCLHPPSGAVALTAVLGGPQIHAAGFGFVIAPVALNSVLLLVMAVLYNNLTGRLYPHPQRLEQQPRHADEMGADARRGFRTEDLQAVLKDYNQVLDVSADDLEDLFLKTEMRAFRRRFGSTRCGEIMSRDIPAVEFATELDEAWRLMHAHGMQALPVVNRARHVIGIATRSDFLRHAELRDYRSLTAKLRVFLHRSGASHSDKHEVVGQIMSAPVKTALYTAPIVELVPLMSDVGLHHVPIVDSERRLVGMVTQTDLVAALYESSLAKLDDDRPVAA